MFKDLFKLAGRRKSKLTASCILSIITSALSIIPFFLIYLLLLELFNPSLNQGNVWYFILLLPVIYAVMYIVLIYSYDLSHRAAYEILYETRINLGERMTQLPLGYFNEKNTGELETIMNENVERLEFFLAHHLPEMMAIIFVPSFLFILHLILDWRMALASSILVFLALAIVVIHGRKWSELVENFLTAQSKVNSTIVEYTQGIAAIKTFNQTAESFQKYQKNMAMWRDNLMKWSKKTAVTFTLFEGFISSTLIVIVPVGIWLYSQGALNAETFLFFLLIGPIFGGLFSRIYQFLNYWLEEKECMDRVNKLRYARVLVDCEENRIPSCLDITFKNVNFSYEGEEKDVLQDISFTIPQGSICALVGPSGAGKTTITRLIPRFWDIEKGEILIDKYNIKNLPFKRLLSYISLVFQHVFLFNDNILENIRLGNPDASEEEVMAAASVAHCTEFIKKLPNGFNTIIGERGAKLSAGERQRISIARALLKNAPIIILDEATAFIDPENEKLIQEAIGNMIKGKTVLIIAHRLYTIINVDQILVIKRGRIVERGTHEELIKKGSQYNKMWEAHISTLGWGIRR